MRVADVRRVLGLAARLPGLRRIDLEVNYRCPAPVLERAVRLVERNTERFAKAIRAGPAATGRLVLAPDASDDAERVRRVLASWSGGEGTQAILARTNRELLPAAAIALELGIPFRAPGIRLLLEEPALEAVLQAVLGAAAETAPSLPPLVRIEAARRRLAAGDTRAPADEADAAGEADATDEVAATALPDPFARDVVPADDDGPGDDVSPALLASALLAWAPGYADLETLLAAIHDARARLAALRTDDARLTLSTAHATKGLEFDHVAVIAMDAGRFPSARALADSDDPVRAMEEERRLAYVAWTRARRSLTLVYDPAAPSAFMREAFDAAELVLVDDGA